MNSFHMAVQLFGINALIAKKRFPNKQETGLEDTIRVLINLHPLAYNSKLRILCASA